MFFGRSWLPVASLFTTVPSSLQAPIVFEGAHETALQPNISFWKCWHTLCMYEANLINLFIYTYSVSPFEKYMNWEMLVLSVICHRDWKIRTHLWEMGYQRWNKTWDLPGISFVLKNWDPSVRRGTSENQPVFMWCPWNAIYGWFMEFMIMN